MSHPGASSLRFPLMALHDILCWYHVNKFCLHDTNTKCHAGESHPGVSSPWLLYRGENFTPVQNLATVPINV